MLNIGKRIISLIIHSKESIINSVIIINEVKDLLSYKLEFTEYLTLSR